MRLDFSTNWHIQFICKSNQQDVDDLDGLRWLSYYVYNFDDNMSAPSLDEYNKLKKEYDQLL